MDKKKLIEGLNIDLSHEYQAIIMYNTYAASVSGIHRPELKQFFENEIPEELQHAQFLSGKVSALNGVPTTTPAEIPPADTPQKMLENVLQAESETIKRYVQRRNEAEAYGDFGLVNDLEEIISDETRHKEETEKLLRDYRQD